MNPQPGELTARMAIVHVVERRRIRYAHMVGVTPQIMRQGMRTDYKLVDQLSDKLRERMLRAKTLTVTAKRGTAFAAHFDEKLDWVKTSGLISPRYWSNLPAGEVFHDAGDGGRNLHMRRDCGRLFSTGSMGDLQSTPMKLTIESGRLIQVECARKDLQKEFGNIAIPMRTATA